MKRIVAFALAACAAAACSPPRDASPAAAGPLPVVDLGAVDAEIGERLADMLDAVRQAPRDASRRGELGMALEVNGFAEAALASYRQAALLDVEEPRWPYYQALLTAHRGQLDDALAFLGQAIERDADHAPAWLWRGTWLLDLDQVEEASAAFARARVLGAAAAAAAGLARVALREGKPQQALDLLASFAAEERHPYVHKLRGEAYARLGQIDAARAALAKVDGGAGSFSWPDARSERKKRFEGSLSAKLAKLREQLLGSGAAEVLPVLEELRERHPHHQGLLGALGEAYRQTGRREQELAVLRHGLERHPDYYAFHLNIADHYLRRDGSGDKDRAQAHLDKAIALNPEVGWAHAQRGLLLAERGRLDAAIASFEAALALDPANATVHYYAGMVEAARRRWPEAIARFQRAVARDIGFALAHAALDRALMEAGRHDEGKRTLKAAKRLGALVAEEEVAP